MGRQRWPRSNRDPQRAHLRVTSPLKPKPAMRFARSRVKEPFRRLAQRKSRFRLGARTALPTSKLSRTATSRLPPHGLEAPRRGSAPLLPARAVPLGGAAPEPPSAAGAERSFTGRRARRSPVPCRMLPAPAAKRPPPLLWPAEPPWAWAVPGLLRVGAAPPPLLLSAPAVGWPVPCEPLLPLLAEHPPPLHGQVTAPCRSSPGAGAARGCAVPPTDARVGAVPCRAAAARGSSSPGHGDFPAGGKPAMLLFCLFGFVAVVLFFLFAFRALWVSAVGP